MPPYPEKSLNSWRFDGTGWLTNTRTAPLIYDNLQLVESWSGHALQMTGPSGLLALPNNQPDGIRNLTPEEGTMRLWFASDWTSQPDGTGPGVASRLFEFGAWSSTAAQGWWSLAVTPDGTLLGFLAQDANGQTTILQTPIRWHSGEWHQIALSWSAQETVLFLDGVRAATGPGAALAPLTSFTGIQGFCIGSDVHGGQLAGGQFEEVFTFDRACDDAELAFDYWRNASRTMLGPMTPAEEESMIVAATEDASKRAIESGFPSLPSLQSTSQNGSLSLQMARESATTVRLTLYGTKTGVRYNLLSAEKMTSDPQWLLMDSPFDHFDGDDNSPPGMSVPISGHTRFFRVIEMPASGFRGLNAGDTHDSVPDSMGAVGRLYFVEIINGKVAMFDRTDTATAVPEVVLDATDFFTVFDSQGQAVFQPTAVVDARILYDQAEDRWVASALDRAAGGRVILAVSNGANPTSGWTKHLVDMQHVNIPGFAADFPTLAIDSNGIYLTWAYLVSQGLRPHDVIAIDKQAAYNKDYLDPGDYTRFYQDPDAAVGDQNRWTIGAWSIQPVVNFDAEPLGGFVWFLAKAPPEDGPEGFKGGAIYYRAMTWTSGRADWVSGMSEWQRISAETYRDYFDLDAQDISAPTLGPEAGTIIPLQIGSIRDGSKLKSMPVMRNGYAYVCYHVGLDGPDGHYNGDASGSNVDRSAIQWVRMQVQLGANGAPPALEYVTHGRVYSTKTTPEWYFYPSLMVNDNGDMIIGFSGSSETLWISAFYNWQKVDGSAADTPQLIWQGEDFFTGNLWGDYSATSLDPLDSHTIWTVQQFSKRAGTVMHNPLYGLFWGTRIARIIIAP